MAGNKKRLIRILHFRRQERGRFEATLLNAANAERLTQSLRQTAPFSRYSQKTVTVMQTDSIENALGLPDNGANKDLMAGDILLLNSRYIVNVDEARVLKIVDSLNADILSFTVCPALQGGRELIRLTGDGHVAGFRRLYEDVIEPAGLHEWPHAVFFKKSAHEALRECHGFDGHVRDCWNDFQSRGLRWLHFHAGGQLLDLESEQGVSVLLRMSDAAGATSIPTLAGQTEWMMLRAFKPRTGMFRQRRLFSYARFGKRLFDILVSICILAILFPLLAVVALLVKLTSPGPIIYGAHRQGLRGKPFDCLKFRTMIVRAEAFQDRLRAVNQVDGPQFKIDNDPRISGIGKFLRDTCIDELPQFLNVLAGQMSVVGPRPSPVSENESCPQWRDARLSVRPGITGLWQVCRTRRSSMDFQEWVYYDIKYVRNLSFGMDLMICLRTAQKLIGNFLDQFG